MLLTQAATGESLKLECAPPATTVNDFLIINDDDNSLLHIVFKEFLKSDIFLA